MDRMRTGSGRILFIPFILFILSKFFSFPNPARSPYLFTQ